MSGKGNNMKLDENWANMVEDDPLLLVEVMACTLEMEEDLTEGNIEFIAGMRYTIELLSDKNTLIMDSFTLFKKGE